MLLFKNRIEITAFKFTFIFCITNFTYYFEELLFSYQRCLLIISLKLVSVNCRSIYLTLKANNYHYQEMCLFSLAVNN